MTCPACTAAEQNPRTGRFTDGCRECAARGLAQTPEMHRALTGKGSTEILDAIRKLFGDDDYEAGRKSVWAWVKRLQGGDAKC